jgi:hypothetical protein
MIGASNTPFRIKPPKLIADSATESAAGNVYAAKLSAGQTAATDAMNNGGRGLSASASNSMYAGQKMAQGASEGAQAAAGIRAEDQQFNEGQRNAYEMEREGALLFDKNEKIKRSQIGFDRMFAAQQGRSSVAMARQRASMQLRLALMSKGLA